MPKDEDYKKAFDDAKSKYRQHGAGGVLLPGTDNSTPTETPKQDPAQNIVVKGGVVFIGGANIKTSTGNKYSNIKIFDYGKENNEKEAKKPGEDNI